MSLTAPAEAPVYDGTPRGDQLRRALEGVIGVPATEGNRVESCATATRSSPRCSRRSRRAEHTIDFLTFVYWKGEIGDASSPKRSPNAHAAGVRVRVLLDGWGAHPIDTIAASTMMEAAGVQVRWFRPLAPVPARPGRTTGRTARC